MNSDDDTVVCLEAERALRRPTIPCPFTYANGRRCRGVIYRARAYGPVRWGEGYVRRENVRKYRLWCSVKDDHAGAISSYASKERMEFYPDELEPGVEERLWQDDTILG